MNRNDLSVHSGRVCAIAATLAFAALPALAGDAGGSCRHKSKEFKFVDGIYFTVPNTFEATKQDRVLVFTSIVLDKVAIGRAEDKAAAVREQVWDVEEGARIQLSINEEDAVWAMQFSAGGTGVSQSGSGVGALSLTGESEAGLAGTFKLEGDDDDLNCDLHFGLDAGVAAAAVAAAPPLPKGTSLPVGGGEIGKVLMTNFEAMRTGDVDGLLATASSETRRRMEDARKAPEFPKMLAMMKAFVPTRIKITGGQDFGDSADLTLESSDEDGAKSTGIARMVKEGGAWKVVKTSMKSGG